MWIRNYPNSVANKFLQDMCSCNSVSENMSLSARSFSTLVDTVCTYTLEDLNELLAFHTDCFKIAIIKSQINVYGKNCNQFRKFINKYIEEYNSVV